MLISSPPRRMFSRPLSTSSKRSFHIQVERFSTFRLTNSHIQCPGRAEKGDPHVDKPIKKERQKRKIGHFWLVTSGALALLLLLLLFPLLLAAVSRRTTGCHLTFQFSWFANILQATFPNITCHLIDPPFRAADAPRSAASTLLISIHEFRSIAGWNFLLEKVEFSFPSSHLALRTHRTELRAALRSTRLDTAASSFHLFNTLLLLDTPFAHRETNSCGPKHEFAVRWLPKMIDFRSYVHEH